MLASLPVFWWFAFRRGFALNGWVVFAQERPQGERFDGHRWRKEKPPRELNLEV